MNVILLKTRFDMKYSKILILFVVIFSSCTKGDTFCKLPTPVTGFHSVRDFYSPSEHILINLTFVNAEETDIENTLYSFSTPDIFINEKGDFPEFIKDRMNYIYILKDTTDYPPSIEISAYSFNDCGESEKVYFTINFE